LQTLAAPPPYLGRSSPTLNVVLDHLEVYKVTRKTAMMPLFSPAIPIPLNLYVFPTIFGYWPPVSSKESTTGVAPASVQWSRRCAST
jgi:hypothetical protein